jgi:flavodoxin
MTADRRAIVYASERGTSKGIAETLGKQTGIQVVPIADFKVDEIAAYALLVFVVPTYGRGHPPPSAGPAWTQIQALTPTLTDLKFAVFGIGSTHFDATFLGFAKDLEKKLTELGATKVAALGQYDQSTKADPVPGVTDWVKTLGIPLP